MIQRIPFLHDTISYKKNYPFPVPALSKKLMYVVVALGDVMTSNRQCVFLIVEEILKPKYKQIFQ
jgi:hypothetical protein